MDDFIIARIIHVVAILFWIGGVAFVTSVVMPSIREGFAPEERLAAFRRIEARFAWQARIWVALAGASGFWMVYRADLWNRYSDPRFWWMHAMLLVWLLFATMLFVIEPLFLHRRMTNSSCPAEFKRMERMHRLLLLLTIIAVVGAIGGSHGLFRPNSTSWSRFTQANSLWVAVVPGEGRNPPRRSRKKSSPSRAASRAPHPCAAQPNDGKEALVSGLRNRIFHPAPA